MANLNDNNVSVIDGSTNKVITIVSVGTSPRGVVFDPSNGNIYVSNRDDNSLSVISGASNSWVGNIVVGSEPLDMALDTSNGDIYVAERQETTSPWFPLHLSLSFQPSVWESSPLEPHTLPPTEIFL